MYRHRAAIARLHSLAVDPAAQGGGAGRSLLRAAERGAVGRGARILRLAVRTDNAAAIRLYKASGYQELRTEIAYYADGMSASTMEKNLAEAQ